MHCSDNVLSQIASPARRLVKVFRQQKIDLAQTHPTLHDVPLPAGHCWRSGVASATVTSVSTSTWLSDAVTLMHNTPNHLSSKDHFRERDTNKKSDGVWYKSETYFPQKRDVASDGGVPVVHDYMREKSVGKMVARAILFQEQNGLVWG